ncbi:uncharacterized protein K460DRAFT_266946, partial [Cucurbitaria berberidis CBS 394.84]
QGASLRQTNKLFEVQRVCHVADEMLSRMYEVKNHMAEFEAYIQTQKDENKPLYQWAKYTGYRAISRAISGLDEAATLFEPVHLPKEDVKVYLRKATQFSLSVSKVAVFAMGVMGAKFDTCIDEIEESDLSVEGQVNAMKLVTAELKKLVKHCTRATGRVYATLDLLRESLTVEGTDRELDIPSIQKLISESEAQRRASRKSWIWTAAGILLSAATSAAIGITAAHLGPAGFDLALNSNGRGNGLYAQVVDLVQRTQAVTNLTGEIYSVKLQDIDDRYQELASLSEAHGLRIDNIVDALGPSNTEGLYYSTTPKPDYPVPDAVYHHIRKISDNTGQHMQRLYHDMEQMRKNINRMDLRLIKRLEKVDRMG